MLFLFFVSVVTNAQDIISTGCYKLSLSKFFDKEKIEKECLEQAKLNAIENAFGVFLVDSTSQKTSYVRKNNVENMDISFNNHINSIVSGKWVREVELPAYSYYEKDGFKWLSVTVKGFVREIKPKSFNEDREAMGLYMKDLYLKYPFSDITIVENYENKYLISVVELIKANYKSNSDMSRVAQTKARAQVSRYINGIKTEDIFIIKTTDLLNDNKESVADTYSAIKESSFGWVNSMDLLAVFQDETGLKSVFIYSKKIENEKK